LRGQIPEGSDLATAGRPTPAYDARNRGGATAESKESRRGKPDDAREWISRQFTRVEDVVYVGLGILLGASALALLIAGAIRFGEGLFAGDFPATTIGLLDRLLLILMIVELLYTVQVSFREHALIPEPFLIVGLIAATRRILVLTAEFGTDIKKGDAIFRDAMLELGLLTVLVVAMVVSLVLLRKKHPDAVADRA
jgi:uncharacterized membrane protein (DUF373 family)